MKNQINDNNLTKENYNLNELDLFFDNLIKNNSSLKNFLKIEDIKTFQPLIDIIKSELAIKYPSLISKKSNDTSLTKDDNENLVVDSKKTHKRIQINENDYVSALVEIAKIIKRINSEIIFFGEVIETNQKISYFEIDEESVIIYTGKFREGEIINIINI